MLDVWKPFPVIRRQECLRGGRDSEEALNGSQHLVGGGDVIGRRPGVGLGVFPAQADRRGQDRFLRRVSKVISSLLLKGEKKPHWKK